MVRPRTLQIETIIRRADRLIAHGTKTSATFTRWRLALFLIGLMCTVTLYKLNWYNSGNLSLALFLAIFVAVAVYHNKVETQIHRLRQWKHIKQTHLARIALDWANIPTRSAVGPSSHPYAVDLHAMAQQARARQGINFSSLIARPAHTRCQAHG